MFYYFFKLFVIDISWAGCVGQTIQVGPVIAAHMMLKETGLNQNAGLCSKKKKPERGSH